MAPHIIKPHQTLRERFTNWVMGLSPSVKAAIIAAAVIVVLTPIGWLVVKPKSEISIGSISGGNNQFGHSNTMIVNPDPSNLVRSLEAVFIYDLALSWTKDGPKSSSAFHVGNQLLRLTSTIDTSRPPIDFISTVESTEVIEGLGLRGRYKLQLDGFSKTLNREDLTNYDLAMSLLKLSNYERNVVGETVTVTGIKIQIAINSEEMYETSVPGNQTLKLSDLNGRGAPILFKNLLFAPDKRVRW